MSQEVYDESDMVVHVAGFLQKKKEHKMSLLHSYD